MHCFFIGASIISGFLCLFPNNDADSDGDDKDDDGDDDDGAGDEDTASIFFSLLAFFHKLLTLSTSAYKKAIGEKWNNILQ